MNIDQVIRLLEGPVQASNPFNSGNILLSLLLAFVLGQLLAWVYHHTHQGLSYSRNFVQALILITVVVAMVMFAIGNSLVTAVGLMGALAIIRFRNMVKDTRDIAFIFNALVIGMACGAMRYGIAVIGTMVLLSIVVYLHWTGFGTHQPHNGFLRFNLEEQPGMDIAPVLRRYCSNFTLISVQGAGSGNAEYAYQVLVRDSRGSEGMIRALEELGGLAEISLTMQEQLLEV